MSRRNAGAAERKGSRRLAGRLAVGALAVFALSAQAQQPPAQPAQPPPAQAQPALPAPTVPGGITLTNASLFEVINLLAQDLHINYVLDPAVKNGTVTINTYGQVRDVDLRPLLETILRMNNLAMVQVGNIFRIIPAQNVARQPISPVTETNGANLTDDERMVLNLVFLRYVTSGEMQKVLAPFVGDGGQLTSYDPANLLIILDNSRNMRRTLELVSLFDSDTFAGQRVRAFEMKNGRPSDLSKELDNIFKAYALSGEKGTGAVHFLAIDRINTLLAIAPNPGAFAEVEKWLAKLDIPAKAPVGSTDNYVYKLKYGQAEILGSVINQLYGGCGFSGAGMYGGLPGATTYPATGYAGGYAGGSPYGFGGGMGAYGGGGYGAGAYGGGMYGGGAYGAGGYPGGGYGAGGYPGAMGMGMGGGFGVPCVPQITNTGVSGAVATPFNTGTATPPATPGSTTTATTPADQTGTYLVQSSPYGKTSGPRIIPNPYNNTLTVQATPQEWQQIEHLLDQMDIPPRQVLIDAKIYEVNLTGAFSAGVEAFLQSRGASNPAGITSRQLQGSSNLGGSTQLLLSAGTLVGQSRQLLALLEAQETTTKAKVLSAPSVIATDSIPASITVGDSVPTLSSIATSAVQQNGNSLFTNSISNTSTGIGLNILARVNPSGVVTMVINQNVTSPTPTTTSNIDSPSFSQRNVSTQVTVEDGDTIAIGGIIEESSTDTSSGIPLLHRIPYLGAAFGAKSSNKSRTELIIFLTPRVIYDTTQIADATQELKDKVRNLRKDIRNQ